jgi:DNA-directed RNA polymerase subunit RPC12/RpoP
VLAYKCAVCEKHFSTEKQLKRHQLAEGHFIVDR